MKVMIFLLLLTAPAAGAEFERVVGGPAMDRGVFVEPTRDGGYVVVGATANTEGGDEDVYLVRFDAAGEIAWTRTYGGAGEDNGWCVREVAGGFVIAGFTKSFGAGGYDFYLIRTDAAGEVVWSREFGGPTDDRCWSLVVTIDGGYALVGETVVGDDGAQDVWLLKTDKAGEEQWSRTYGGDAADRGFGLVQTADGGFVIAGQTFSEGAGDRDAYVIRTDRKGALIWSRTFGGALSDVGHGVDIAADGNYLVFGYTTSLAATYDDPYLMKLAPDGDTLWTRVLKFPTVSHVITGVQGARGGLYLTGFSHDPLTRSGAALLIHTDDDGNQVWSREILPARTGQSFGYTIRATPDGGCVLTGHTTVRSAGDLDLFLVKVGGAGGPGTD